MRGPFLRRLRQHWRLAAFALPAVLDACSAGAPDGKPSDAGARTTVDGGLRRDATRSGDGRSRDAATAAPATLDAARDGRAALPDARPGLPSIVPPAEFCARDELAQYACCVFERVNRFRRAEGVGLRDFAWDPAVADVAAWYAARMAVKSAVSHGLDGRACGGRLTAFGVGWSSCGENVAGNTGLDPTASCLQIVDQQWANSSSHRRAMLSSDWSRAGVGAARAGGWWYVTLNFLEP